MVTPKKTPGHGKRLSSAERMKCRELSGGTPQLNWVWFIRYWIVVFGIALRKSCITASNPPAFTKAALHRKACLMSLCTVWWENYSELITAEVPTLYAAVVVTSRLRLSVFFYDKLRVWVLLFWCLVTSMNIRMVTRVMHVMRITRTHTKFHVSATFSVRILCSGEIRTNSDL